VPKSAVLQLEEPITTDADNYPPVRAGPMETLDYEVIIHLDRLHDYSLSSPQ